MKRKFILALVVFPLCLAAQVKTEYWGEGKKKSEGKVKEGLNDSVWTYWFENGTVSARITYKDGHMNGRFCYYWGNGKLMQDGYAVNDAQNDTLSNYYITGKIKSRAFFKDNKMTGPYAEWYDT